MKTDENAAARFRTRRWALALTPLALGLALPTALVAAVRDRLPDLAYGTGDPAAPDTWFTVVAAPTIGIAVALLVVVAILIGHRRGTTAPAGPVVLCWVAGTLAVGSTVASIVRTIDLDGPPAGPEPWWAGRLVAAVGLVLLSVLVHRWRSDAGQGLPEASTRPGPDAPRIEFAANERVVWSRSLVSRRTLGSAAVFWAFAALWFFIGSTSVFGTYWALLMVLAGAVLLVNGWARVRIDDRRVAVVGPLLGRTLVDVEPRHVVEARACRLDDAFDTAGWDYGVVDRPDAFGYRANHDSGALALTLTDGRHFVVTVDDAATAAALVDTQLDRREVLRDADPDRSDVDRPAG